ncbi:KAP family P-loop NTPase fold protein [Pseudomonas marginalis]|uniref:KAP family P-loop NTPase fold protein n=1 Tax=Pseudomonas marginalis TaxID=298 RepID=UPI0034D4F3BF
MSNDVGIWSDDLMGREPSAKFLTSYLLSNPHIKVLNVNSPWGAGKSFFLNRWKRELSENHVCVFFNAWETDYTSDPLVALVTCIEQQTMDSVSLGSTDAGKNVIKLTTTLMKKAAPLIAKGLVKKFTGVEVEELLGKDAVDGSGELAGGVVEALIKEQSKTAVHVEDFKKAILEKLGQAAINFNKSKPAFIFIDELDRCRPTYAIELLERVKHFFELEDCRFIVASDSAQLAHSVRAVYGEKFYSERYLSRFFDAEFRLDNTDIYTVARCAKFDFDYVRLQVCKSGYAHATRAGSKDIQPSSNTVCNQDREYPECALILIGMAKYFKVELREMLRYSQQINSMVAALPKHSFHYFWAAYLVFSKAADEELYQSLGAMSKADFAIDEYERNKAVSVDFTFQEGRETVGQIAKLYARIIHSSSDELRLLFNNASGWRENVIRCGMMDIGELRLYKKLVELAHRIA